MASYSTKSLKDKLGLKPGFSAVFLYAPLSYIESLGDIDYIEIFPIPKEGHDFIHMFVKDKAVLVSELPKLMSAIKPTGMIWISWPRSTRSGQAVVKTDMNENVIRDVCLPLGLVDIKVASIDDIWSGLKFAIRKENR